MKIIAGALLLTLTATRPLAATEIGITVVTPARGPRAVEDVPGAVDVITAKDLKALPGNALDEKLAYVIPGAVSTRQNGIYSYSSVVTLRGLPGAEQGRTLVLLDGIPVNTGATGAVNWNRLSLEDIDRIEVFKGPASSLYGSNAAAGVINVITKKPVPGYLLKTSYGSFNTVRAEGKAGVKRKRLSLSVSGSWLSSDGYISTPENQRSIYTVKRFVREKEAGVKASMDLGDGERLDAQYSRYTGVRGEGWRERTADGQSRRFDTDFARASWNGEGDALSWQTLAYYQHEDYSRLNEYYKGAAYYHIDVGALREDSGAQASVSFMAPADVTATLGADYKLGSVNATDHQILPATVTPDVKNRGRLSQYAPYAQAEKKLFSDRLKLLAGLRYDNAHYFDGLYDNPTNPGWGTVNGPQSERYWERFSPKLAAGWQYSLGMEQYISYGRGFRPPPLEDMCLSLLRGTQVTIANPDLKPETVDTLETGFRLSPLFGLYLDPAVYYTNGSDFIYETNTGVTININGAKPIYKKQNVSRVTIYGAELPAKYLFGDFSLSGAYAWSHSRVDDYPANTAIEGKSLTYSPRHTVSASLGCKMNPANLNFGWKYKSKQFISDANTAWVKAYSVFSASATRSFTRYITAKLSVDNILDKRFQESSTDIAPGRDITVSVEAKF